MANLALAPMRLKHQQGLFSSGMDSSHPEDAMQNWFDGAPLVVVAGYMQECGANPARIEGVANANAHNDATRGTHNAAFTMTHPNIVYEISIDKASAQAGAGAVLALTNVGASYGITKDTLGGSPAGTPLYWYLDVDKSGANQRVILVGFPVFSPPGTVNGRCYVKFLEAPILQ